MAYNRLSDEQFAIYAQAVRQAESGGDYQKVNENGYIGAYQMSADQLSHVGYVDRRKRMAQLSKERRQKHIEFLREEENWNIEGGMPVFLVNQKVQDEAFEASTRREERQLEKVQAINASTPPAQQAGLLAASHLVGPEDTKKFADEGPSAIKHGDAVQQRYNTVATALSTGRPDDTQVTSQVVTPVDTVLAGEQATNVDDTDANTLLEPVIGAPLTAEIVDTVEPAPELTEVFLDEPNRTKQITGGSSATGKKQSFQQDLTNIDIDAKANPLSDFATYTYNLALYQMGVKSYVDLMRSDATSPLEAVNNVQKTLIARSGGIGRPINEQFDIDFFIDSLQVTNVGAPNRQAANTNAVDIKFEIFEPRGITLIERLKDASDALGEGTNYVMTPYLLQIDFKGYDDEGKEINTNILPRFLPIKIVSLKFQITSSGAAYKIEAVPFHQDVFGSVLNTIPLNVQVKATTVGDIFSSSTTIIQDEKITDIDEEGEQSTETVTVVKGQARTLSEAITQFNEKTTKPKRKTKLGVEDIITPAEAELFDEVSFNPGGDIANSLLVTQQFDALNTDMKEADDAFKQYAGAIKGKVQMEDNQIFRINAGTGIVSLLNFIVVASNYMERNVVEQGVPKGENTPVYWWKIKPKILDIKGWDKKSGRYKFKIRYDVIPTTVFYSDYPWAPKSKPTGNGFHKLYNYVFTGENTEVVNFDLNFNTAYYQAIQFGTGIPDDALQEPNSTYTTTKQAQAVGTESEALKSDDTVEAKRSKDLLGTIMQEGADLVELKLDILGDPDYIPTGDGFFQKDEIAGRLYTQPYWPDGTINYDLTIPHVQVNFKTPTEYDDLTGLQDPTVDKKYSSSAFSGIYKVIEVRSTFQGGSFTQRLNLVRTKTQPDDIVKVQEQPAKEIQTQPSPPTFNPEDLGPLPVTKPQSTLTAKEIGEIQGEQLQDEVLDNTPPRLQDLDNFNFNNRLEDSVREIPLLDLGNEHVASDFDKPQPPTKSSSSAPADPVLDNEDNIKARIKRQQDFIERKSDEIASGNLSLLQIQIAREHIGSARLDIADLRKQLQAARQNTDAATGYPGSNF